MKSLIAKAFWYRVGASVGTILVAWLVTGSIETGTAIGGLEFTLKLAGYMAYESVWSATQKRTGE